MSALVMLIVWLAVLGLVFYVVTWALGQLPIPEPFPVIIRVILVIIILVIALNLVVGLLGNPFELGRIGR